MLEFALTAIALTAIGTTVIVGGALGLLVLAEILHGTF
jgi:hypothetical protein